MPVRLSNIFQRSLWKTYSKTSWKTRNIVKSYKSLVSQGIRSSVQEKKKALRTLLGPKQSHFAAVQIIQGPLIQLTISLRYPSLPQIVDVSMILGHYLRSTSVISMPTTQTSLPTLFSLKTLKHDWRLILVVSAIFTNYLLDFQLERRHPITAQLTRRSGMLSGGCAELLRAIRVPEETCDCRAIKLVFSFLEHKGASWVCSSNDGWGPVEYGAFYPWSGSGPSGAVCCWMGTSPGNLWTYEALHQGYCLVVYLPPEKSISTRCPLI